jgi:hypothetical protein
MQSSLKSFSHHTKAPAMRPGRHKNENFPCNPIRLGLAFIVLIEDSPSRLKAGRRIFP